VLFALEEMTSWFRNQLLWYAFFTTAVVSVAGGAAGWVFGAHENMCFACKWPCCAYNMCCLADCKFFVGATGEALQLGCHT
jgi:hypothetical protein